MSCLLGHTLSGRAGSIGLSGGPRDFAQQNILIVAGHGRENRGLHHGKSRGLHSTCEGIKGRELASPRGKKSRAAFFSVTSVPPNMFDSQILYAAQKATIQPVLLPGRRF